jgi:hypothetical protein
METGAGMKIILSRKGFDSASGGTPSPIFPDGRMVSLPIPDKHSSIRYSDIQWHEYSVGTLVSDLTNGRIPETHFAHLDPDIHHESLPRQAGWRAIFGQTGSAQGHLQNNSVGAGDLFLFFGLFKEVRQFNGKLLWDKQSPQRHVLWGWIQVDAVLRIDECSPLDYEWARYHPHFHRDADKNNVLYIARESLTLPGDDGAEQPGSGTFIKLSEKRVLTSRDSAKPSLWQLPHWFYPRDGKFPLTYHSDLDRWQRTETCTRLSAAARGQEFILDAGEYPEAIGWVRSLIDE